VLKINDLRRDTDAPYGAGMGDRVWGLGDGV